MRARPISPSCDAAIRGDVLVTLIRTATAGRKQAVIRHVRGLMACRQGQS